MHYRRCVDKREDIQSRQVWLADDATLVASSKKDVEDNIMVLIESGSNCGLNLNKTKTKILHVRGTEDVKEIGEYTVEDEVQYLGIKLGGRGRDIFRAEKRIWTKKAKKKANEVISQIKKSFDKVIVGKAIWKLMMIPGLLFGKAVVVTAKSTIDKIQRIENRVWRYLLGLGGYTTVEALRGEIGASMMISRIMETMLLYVIDTLSSNFEQLKTYMNHEIEKGKGQWIKAINDYREKLEISWTDLRAMEKKTLKKKIKEYDTYTW